MAVLVAGLVAAGAAAVPSSVAGASPSPRPAGASAPAPSTRGGPGAHTAFGSDWPVYHQDAAGTGVDTSGTDLSSQTHAWTATLDGQIFGEPLVEAGRIYVATENDTVYALSARTGAVLWSHHLATPFDPATVPGLCGDIDPTVGITGTPVIDPTRDEIFVVAAEQAGRTAAHHLFGLDIYTGAMILDQDVDPGGVNAAFQLQRTGLTLDQGRVVFGYGGNSGDCGQYHGWVMSVPESGGAVDFFEVDAAQNENQGAVWMGGGAPVIDGGGDVWVADGNGSAHSFSDPYDDSDAVLKLSPSMQLLGEYHPTTWATDNANDFDLGSSSPALVGSDVVQVGKSGTAYLISQADPGGPGAGGQLAETTGLCGNDMDGGTAVVGTTVYVGCRSGVLALQVDTSTPSITQLWQATGNAAGPPIVAGGLVWTMSIESQVVLYGLDPTTGSVVVEKTLGSGDNHFATPSVADGLLLAPSGDQVDAFSGPAGLPPAPSAPPARPGYWLAARDGGIFTFGGAGYHGSMGGHHLNAPIVGMAATGDGGGYWLVGSDGGIFNFGDAHFYGSHGGQHLNAPVVAMARTGDGKGYWLAASDGGVFTYGDAHFHGSHGGQHLNAPVVGMAPTADGGGYWLVASDGGVFTYGDAGFHGSHGGAPLNSPVVGMAPTADGGGYWLVAADGGVFTYGDATFSGSHGGSPVSSPVVAMAVHAGGGYWLATSGGDVYAYGAPDEGYTDDLNAPVVAMTAYVPPV